MKIQWNKVTWYSKLLALAVLIILPILGFYLGIQYGRALEDVRQTDMSIRYVSPPPGTMHCGGFIRNAPTCPADYHCQLNRIPDTGGFCVHN